MRIPSHYQNPGWQRFFAGAAMGAIVSWLVFLFLFGVLQEGQVKLIKEQQDKLNDLNHRYNILIEDHEKLNEQTKNKLKIQDFKVEIINYEKFMLDSLSKHNLIDAVVKDLNHLIAKDTKSVSENKELLQKAIENKVYELDEKKYRLRIYSVYFDTTLELSLKMELKE